MRLGKSFRVYAVVTQYLLLVVTLLVIGVYLGSKIDDYLGTELWDRILGLVGIIAGITSFIFFMLKQGDKDGK